MQMKDATRRFGSVVLFIPLILIFLTAADSAFACPGNSTGVAYRTRTSRTVSYMPTTVITYRAPASYRRCGDNMFDTRGKRYVAVRSGNSYYNGSGARSVAVRNAGYYAMPRTRYIAVRDVDYDYAPRYVAVRPRYPVYRISDSRYAEIRSGYRSGNGIVRYIDFEDEPRHVAVTRRVPAVRYVAVNRDNDYYDEGRTKYVAVRRVDSGCTRAVARRSCLDQVETTSVRRVVLQNDDAYPVRSKHVVFDDDGDMAYSSRTKRVVLNNDDDDDDYIAVANDTPKYVEYRDPIYSNVDSDDYVAAGDMEAYPEAVRARTVTYDPASYGEDDQAYLDDGGMTYVADTEDACLSRHAVHRSPEIMRTRAVSYVPIEDVDDDTYIEADDAAPLIRHVALVEDQDLDDVDTAYVHNESVHYVPADNVRYVPVSTMRDSGAGYISDDECSTMVSSVNTEPVYVADDSTALVEDVDSDVLPYPSNTQIASHYGYRDGFEDGQEAALERDAYHPENSGDFQKATEGYESDFGDKDVYKDVYRDSYLRGYRAGFRSVGAG